MMSEPQIYTLLFLVFCCVTLIMNAILGVGREINAKRIFSNKHEKVKSKQETPEDLLNKMRHDRGLNREGHIDNLNYHVGRLVTQSGLRMQTNLIYPICIASSVVLGLFLSWWKEAFIWSLAGGILGAVLPILVLFFLVKRRRQKAASQLADALDVIIRSLRAGHPVPVALSLVGREMPDPIGTEFGMASDELSFGGSVSVAIQRMADRIGQDDFDLFAAMIRLQEKTGGNLAELLESNAATIRARQRLRLKVKAASAEGRASALILNAAPIGLYLVVTTMAPDFFGEVEDNPMMNYMFVGITIWMIIGNLIMRKMINFKV